LTIPVTQLNAEFVFVWRYLKYWYCQLIHKLFVGSILTILSELIITTVLNNNYALTLLSPERITRSQ